MRMVMFVCSLALLAATVSRINELQDIRCVPSNATGAKAGADYYVYTYPGGSKN